jgi:hypothetical protein
VNKKVDGQTKRKTEKKYKGERKERGEAKVRVLYRNVAGLNKKGRRILGLRKTIRDSDSGVTLGFYFGTGSKSSDLNEIFLMCYK